MTRKLLLLMVALGSNAAVGVQPASGYSGVNALPFSLQESAGWLAPGAPHVRTAGSTTAHLGSGRGLLEVPPASSSELRRRLPRLGQVLDALEAASIAERRERIRQLPVHLTTHAGVDDAGRSGYWREYRHQAGPSYRRFAVAEDEQSATSLSNSCEYTDPDGIYYSGDCATQAELDDAIILYLALEAEGAAAEAMAAGAVAEICSWEDPELVELCVPDPERGAPNSGFAAHTHVLDLEGVGDDSYSAYTECTERHGVLQADCVGMMIAYGGTILNHGWRMFKLGAAIGAANPVAGAIWEAAVLAGVGTAALLAATHTLVACLE